VPQGERLVITRPFSKSFELNTAAEEGKPPKFFNFYGTVIYPPVVYFPQVAAIWIGEAAGLSIEWTIRLGRLINAGICIAFIWWALTLIPYGRSVLMITALLPPTAAAAASFGQDGLIIGTSFVLFAAGLKASVERRWSAQNIAIATMTGIAVTISKIVYLPLVMLAALPKPSGESWVRWTRVPLFLGFLTALLFGLWTHINSPALVPRIRPWVPAIPEQLNWAISQPLDFWSLIGRTYLMWLPLSWASLYKFGDSTIPIVWTAAAAGTAALFLTMVSGDSHATDLGVARRLWMLLLFATVALLIAIAMFIALAPRGAITIEGIQARYFLPVLPLLLTALMRPGDTGPPALMRLAIALVLIAHVATLGTILNTFYSF
jgi:uncharacterized membrane protein